MVSSKAATVADYLAELPPDRRTEIERVRDLVNTAIPDGSAEGIGYGMIGWFVPLSRYADTYNREPLVYAGLAARAELDEAACLTNSLFSPVSLSVTPGRMTCASWNGLAC